MSASANHAKNKFCKLSNLRNESDVEQNLLVRLLDELGYTEDYRKSKSTIPATKIGKGKKRREYCPDYICYIDKGHAKPVFVIDAKAPNVDANDGVEDAQLYASVMRRSLTGAKPDQFCMGSNGHATVIKFHDSNDVYLMLAFEDFQDGNTKFKKLTSSLSREALKAANDKRQVNGAPWKPVLPSVEEIKAAFQKCHNCIWKRESLLPTAAFYEFTKLIFLKLREDERLHKLMDAGKPVHMTDLHFHTEWIDNNSEVSPNPVNSILFQRLNERLQEEIKKNKKKPIFEPNEQVKLKPSTIRAVVEILQEFDLFGIDEDLNGRMFEVFLSAAVRGKNLGAFFTPRSIVELMVDMAAPAITRSGGHTYIETILDGCCGSGGFLIDVMARMLDQIRNNPALSANAKQLEEQLLTQHIYGIESNPDIARIARINMFLHGDGGSSIYRSDALDKEFHVEDGESPVVRDEISDLKKVLLTEGKQFDIVLTNPPFASAYTMKDEHEKRILSQYRFGVDDTKPSNPQKSAKSNVMFLARYYELLRSGGRMAIVLDNSMLNSHTFSEYREWLRGHFIIRAVIALPKYSFIQAGAGGVTSILYLEKRTDAEQSQPPIFARSVNYTGISKSGKEINENDLPQVLAEWRVFEKTGQLRLKGETPIDNQESDDLFLISPGRIIDRIDVAYHTPSFLRLKQQIDSMAEAGTHEIRLVDSFRLASRIDIDEAGEEVFQYIDIGAIDAERCQIVQTEIQEGTLDDLSKRARLQLREHDVIFPLSYDSFGKVAIVPKGLDGQLASTGFLVIHNDTYEEAVLLWAIVRSQLMQKQFHHIASGYTQRGISKEHLNWLRFPMPQNGRAELIKSVEGFLAKANISRQNELDALGRVTALTDSALAC